MLSDMNLHTIRVSAAYGDESDEDLVCLAKFDMIRYLNLRGCKNLTDAALVWLVDLKTLEVLDLRQTYIGDEAVHWFKTYNPNCEILTGNEL